MEPAVEEAKNAVSGIKKAQLVEVRSMASPPNAVKLAVESICLLLGEKVNTWKDIRAILVKDDFIPRIIQFKTDAISPEITEKMKQYENNPDWEFEKVFCDKYNKFYNLGESRKCCLRSISKMGKSTTFIRTNAEQSGTIECRTQSSTA